MNKKIFAVITILILFFTARLLGGPPFLTDDPQPVDYKHWEFYVASSQEYGSSTVDATSPHIEINYGAVPNIQLHIIAPLKYAQTDKKEIYGYSDTEIGVKFRFINEAKTDFQIGTFPLIEIPTGKKGQLGNGTIQIFLPVWIQKTLNKFTTYGGVGIWHNPGSDKKNWIFAGWEFQYDFSKIFTAGGEIYYQTPDALNGADKKGFNVGGYFNINDNNHMLLSAGRSMEDEPKASVYIAYLLTI